MKKQTSMIDKIFHSTFDFFSHALPGFFMAFAFFILNEDVNTPKEFFELVGSLNFESIIVLFALGFVLGFAFFPLGRFLYKTLGLKIWKKDIGKNVDLLISEKYVMIRELSPINFKYVEIWNMYCAMSHNLAFACILVSLFSLVKIIILSPPNLGFWIGVIVLNVVLFFLFLHRAVVYSNWAAVDLNATIDKLNLQDQAKEIVEIKKG